jgi:hypothetical protein
VEAIAKAFVVGENGLAQVALFPDEIMAFKARRTLLRKPKATEEVNSSRRRAEITSAAVDKEAGALEIAFAGGDRWKFEVPSEELKGAQQIVAELAATGTA